MSQKPWAVQNLTRIRQMDWAGRTEDRGNAGETAGSFFHPSGPSEFGYLIQRKSLIYQLKLPRGVDRAAFHPVNPGFGIVRYIEARCKENQSLADCAGGQIVGLLSQRAGAHRGLY